MSRTRVLPYLLMILMVPAALASSHREAPLIAGLPQYDNTDVYAFRSPEAQKTVTLAANWNSPTGLFARVEAVWNKQSLQDDLLNIPVGGVPREGDDFWQYNAMVGYRFHRSLCEISAGILNIAGEKYHLSPLNSHPELPREQTVVLRCRLSF